MEESEKLPRTPEAGVEHTPSPEMMPSPEASAEGEGSAEAAAAAAAPASVATQVEPLPVAKEEELVRIERILEDGLRDPYLAMTPGQRARFKAEGEQVASRIRTLVAGAKETAAAVFALIREWLGLIPGVNRLFLEQEAKIKTDKVLELGRRSRGETD